MAIQPIGLPASIAFGEDFELDLRPRRLRRGRRVLKLERIPLEILLMLLEHPGEIVTREDIVGQVWGKDVFLDTDNSIRGAIRKIRKALRDDPEQPRFIQTVTGKGYRFIAPVLSRPQTEPATSSELIGKLPSLVATDQGEGAPISADPPPRVSARIGDTFQSKRSWIYLALASCILITSAISIFVIRNRATDIGATKIKSLAVLPLKNLSGDPTQQYFADAVTEELIGRLASIHDLRVISHTSVLQFQNTTDSVPLIAQKLQVDALVEGSVMRDGNRVRVHAQLIRAANDEHLWSESYDRELGDVFALESDVAQSIARKVEVTVSGLEHAQLSANRKVSPEVYESFLKGVYADRNTKEGLERSIDSFQKAIRADPTFAPAYLQLANTYGLLGTVYAGVPPEQTRPKLISAVQKALELDPQLAGAHVLLAETYQRLWNWSESGKEYKRALDLQPNDARAMRGLAVWLLCQGRTEEGVAWIQRAREVDPMNLDGLVGDGFNLFLARRYDEAIQILRSATAVQPDIAIAHWFLGYNLIAKGQPEQAIPELQKALQLSDRSPAVIGVLIRAYAHAGRRAEALRLLDELKARSQKTYVPAGAFINAYLGLGDKERAFTWLERGYSEKSGIIPFLKAHPHFDPIRNDPRFADLLRRVGLDHQDQTEFQAP